MPPGGRHGVRRTYQRSPQQLHRLEPFLKTHLLDFGRLNHPQRLPPDVPLCKLLQLSHAPTGNASGFLVRVSAFRFPVSAFQRLPFDFCFLLSQSQLFGGGVLCYSAPMSKVEQIEAELQRFSPAELKQVRDWLDDFVEDRLEFREDFEAAIQESEREMAVGLRPRVRKL
jgi:hypothetical protein